MNKIKKQKLLDANVNQVGSIEKSKTVENPSNDETLIKETIYEVVTTTAFRKCVKLAEKQGRPIDKLESIVEKLANDESLPAENRDHALTGNLRAFRECHIQPDWLLIYRKNKAELILSLAYIGTHAELFKK